MAIALLLEDEPLISIDLEMTLVEAGFEVFTVMSCTEANKWLTLHRPDIAIVDIELHDGPCTEAVIHLIGAKIPFVVYSGDPASYHAGTPFIRGAWVAKPARPERLVQALRAAILDQVGSPRLETAACEG